MDPLRWPSTKTLRPAHLRLVPPPSSPRSGFTLDVPGEGATLCDPLVVTGHFPRHLRPLLPFRRRWLPCLVLDGKPVARLSAAIFEDNRFALLVAVRPLQEGLHTLSLNGVLGDGAACGGRVFSFRRLPPGIDLLATDRTWVPVRKLGNRVARVTVRIGGHPWECGGWLCGRNGDGWLGVAGLDLERLPPGTYPLEICPQDHPVTSLRLLRLIA